MKIFIKQQLFLNLLSSIVIIFYVYGCFLPTQHTVAASAFGVTLDMLHSIQKTSETTAIIEHGERSKKQVALTFDADMTYGMQQSLYIGEVSTYADRRVIDYLIQNNIKSTVFLTGMWIETYSEETKIMAASPLFELANHSYSHPSFAGECYGLKQIPSSEFSFEIERTQHLLESFTGVNNKYFRFPGGCYNQASLHVVAKEGLETVHWDTVAHDGFNNNADEIITNVLSTVQNGSIIVMHLGGEANAPKTFEALQAIASELKQRGYIFVTVAELLDSPDQQNILSYLAI